MKTSLERAVLAGCALIMIVSPTQWAVRLDELNARLPKAYLSAADLLVPCVFAAYALLVLLERKERSLPRVPAPHGAFFLVAGLSVLRAVDKMLAAGELFQYALYLLFLPLVASRCFQRKEWRQAMSSILPAIVVGVAAWGCVEYLLLARDPWQVKASFGNRNVLSGFLCVGFPLVLGAAKVEAGWRRLWLVLSPIVLLPVLAGGALIAAFAGGACVVGPKWGKKGICALLVGAALFVGAGRWALPERGWRSWKESLSPREDGTPSQRYVEWQAAFNSLEETPYWGVGVGNYQKNIGRFYSTRSNEKQKMGEEDIYNLYLVQLSSTGLLGFGCLVLLMGWVGRALWRGDPALLGAWAAFCLCSGFGALFVRGVFPLFGFLCGAALWMDEERKAGASS